jgi:hypothetical protein
MFLVDLAQGRIIQDEEIKESMAGGSLMAAGSGTT